MKILTNEWKDRIAYWIKTLKKDLFRPVEIIEWESAACEVILSLKDAEKLAFSPVERGMVWGR